MSTVFLSYSSEQANAAVRIELSLKEDGHEVFRDRSSLPAGEAFDSRIREAVAESDLFVFLISGASIAPGRYTLTELKFAEQKWPHPGGHVLPVIVEEVPKDALPAYLRAVTILKPQGNLPAEVAAAVALMSAPWWRRMLQPKRLVPALVMLFIVAGGAWLALPSYLERGQINAQARALIQQSKAQAEFEEAWKLLQEAHAVAPVSREVFEAQENLAMEWLRRAVFRRPDKAYIDALVQKSLPVLSRGATDAKGARLADLLAHTGWAEYLMDRTGGSVDRTGRPGKPRSPEYYRRALEADPRNPYALAFRAAEIQWRMRAAEFFPEARKLFSAAAEAAQANRPLRDYVRFLQLQGLLEDGNPEWAREAIRVANEMRINGEKLPEGPQGARLKRRFWYLYNDNVVRDYANDRGRRFLATLPPAEHLASFFWLFPEDEIPQDVDRAHWLFNYFTARAGVQEYGGDRAGAVASYRRVLAIFNEEKYNASSAIATAKNADAAIKRLSH